MSEPTNPITGPGILWAINQINRRFDREIAKSAPVPPESVMTYEKDVSSGVSDATPVTQKRE